MLISLDYCHAARCSTLDTSAAVDDDAFVIEVAHPEEHDCGKEDGGFRPCENEVAGNLEHDVLPICLASFWVT